MTGKVAMAFEPDSVTIAVADILPMRLVDDSVRNSRKFQADRRIRPRNRHSATAHRGATA